LVTIPVPGRTGLIRSHYGTGFKTLVFIIKKSFWCELGPFNRWPRKRIVHKLAWEWSFCWSVCFVLLAIVSRKIKLNTFLQLSSSPNTGSTTLSWERPNYIHAKGLAFSSRAWYELGDIVRVASRRLRAETILFCSCGANDGSWTFDIFLDNLHKNIQKLWVNKFYWMMSFGRLNFRVKQLFTNFNLPRNQTSNYQILIIKVR
jgi:hypothetical protein